MFELTAFLLLPFFNGTTILRYFFDDFFGFGMVGWLRVNRLSALVCLDGLPPMSLSSHGTGTP